MQPPKFHFSLDNLDELVKGPSQSVYCMKSGGSCHGQPLLPALTSLFAPTLALDRVQHGQDSSGEGRSEGHCWELPAGSEPSLAQPWGSFSQACASPRPFRDVSQLQLSAQGLRQPQDGFGSHGMSWKDKAPVLHPDWQSPIPKQALWQAQARTQS